MKRRLLLKPFVVWCQVPRVGSSEARARMAGFGSVSIPPTINKLPAMRKMAGKRVKCWRVKSKFEIVEAGMLKVNLNDWPRSNTAER